MIDSLKAGSPGRLFGILAALSLLVAAPVSGQDGEVGPEIGSQAPAALVEDLDGNEVELLDLVQGKPALIEFWATWCEQCEELQPQLDAIQAEYGDRLQVVAVAVAVSQSQRRVKRHLEDHDPGYPYLYDANGTAVRAYKAPTTAVIVVLDAEGKVAYTGVGPQQRLDEVVQRVLGMD